MVLRKDGQNGCNKQPNDYPEDTSCNHRHANCRTNDCRASASLAVRASLRDASARPTRRDYNLTDRNRSALAITETELKLIAAPAIIGLRRMPNSG